MCVFEYSTKDDPGRKMSQNNTNGREVLPTTREFVVFLYPIFSRTFRKFTDFRNLLVIKSNDLIRGVFFGGRLCVCVKNKKILFLSLFLCFFFFPSFTLSALSILKGYVIINNTRSFFTVGFKINNNNNDNNNFFR